MDTLPGDVSASSFDSTNAVNDRLALTVAFADRRGVVILRVAFQAF